MRLTRGFMRSLVLLETPDEVAIRIAYALDSPLDMLRLSIACKRFRLRTITGSRMDSGSGSEQGGMPELWSIVEAAARRWLAARPSAQRDWVPHWEDSVCTLGLMHELRLLMAPTRFSQTHSMVTLSAGGTVATLDGPTWDRRQCRRGAGRQRGSDASRATLCNLHPRGCGCQRDAAWRHTTKDGRNRVQGHKSG